jgi:hypothetical protein
LEFSFAVPGTSAAIHTVFPITNSLWTEEKCRLLVETIKAMIVIKSGFDELSWKHFYNLISNKPKLLQQILSPTRYETCAQEERTSTSRVTGN